MEGAWLCFMDPPSHRPPEVYRRSLARFEGLYPDPPQASCKVRQFTPIHVLVSLSAGSVYATNNPHPSRNIPSRKALPLAIGRLDTGLLNRLL